MTVDNEALERSVREMLNQTTLAIGKDVAKLEGIVEAHRVDSYAHRQMVAVYEPLQLEWQRWRSGVDIRLAALAGGLAVFTFIVSVFGVFLVTRIIH